MWKWKSSPSPLSPLFLLVSQVLLDHPMEKIKEWQTKLPVFECLEIKGAVSSYKLLIRVPDYPVVLGVHCLLYPLWLHPAHQPHCDPSIKLNCYYLTWSHLKLILNIGFKCRRRQYHHSIDSRISWISLQTIVTISHTELPEMNVWTNVDA